LGESDVPGRFTWDYHAAAIRDLRSHHLERIHIPKVAAASKNYENQCLSDESHAIPKSTRGRPRNNVARAPNRSKTEFECENLFISYPPLRCPSPALRDEGGYEER
jgi:hypothetical protein